MNHSAEYEHLRRDPPTPSEIVTMPKIVRDEIIAYSNTTLDSIFKGFLDGSRLQKSYNEKNWLPSEELTNASLFAGQGSYSGLVNYTYNHIENLSVELRNAETNKIETHNVPHENILKALGIVERLNKGKTRRTGEPVFAHLCRSVLRSGKMMNFYNNLFNTYNSYTRFTPELAQIEAITSALHDFNEDKIVQDDKSILSGSMHVLPKPDSDKEKLFYLRLARINRRGQFFKLEDLQLDIDSKYIPYLENALMALNRSDINQDEIMERIMATVNEQYSQINASYKDKEDIFEDYVLSGLPMRVKTAADRPDNLATYYTMKTLTNPYSLPPVEKIVVKSLENLTMFDEAELYMMIDNPTLYNDLEYYCSDEETYYSPGILPFSNRRWAVLNLLGLSPNQLLRVPNANDLPELI